MPRTSNYFEKRSELRYEIVDREAAAVQVQRADASNPIDAQLVDISPTGAKLALPVCLRFTEIVQLNIVVKDPSFCALLEAEVCWVRPHESDWFVGVSLRAGIPEVALERLAKAGIIDRRRDPRHPVTSQAIARWELSSEPCPVEVRNYSVGGFCIGSKRPSRVGVSVLLEIDVESENSTRVIYGRVCWQKEQDGVFLLGCEITNGDGTLLFRNIRDRSSNTPQAETRLLTRVS